MASRHRHDGDRGSRPGCLLGGLAAEFDGVARVRVRVHRHRHRSLAARGHQRGRRLLRHPVLDPCTAVRAATAGCAVRSGAGPTRDGAARSTRLARPCTTRRRDEQPGRTRAARADPDVGADAQRALADLLHGVVRAGAARRVGRRRDTTTTGGDRRRILLCAPAGRSRSAQVSASIVAGHHDGREHRRRPARDRAVAGVAGGGRLLHGIAQNLGSESAYGSDDRCGHSLDTRRRRRIAVPHGAVPTVPYRRTRDGKAGRRRAGVE